MEAFLTTLAIIATAIATWYLYLIAKDNLGKLIITSKRENLVNDARFLTEFTSDFFTVKTRLIVELIEYDVGKVNLNEMVFVFSKNKEINDDEYYFDIDLENIKNEVVRSNYKETLKAEYGYKKRIYTTNEIDDLLLGPLEGIGTYKEKGILDDVMIYETFAYYVQTCYENSQIKNYIEYIRLEDNKLKKSNNKDYESDLYNKFDKLYQLCEEQERLKMKRKNN